MKRLAFFFLIPIFFSACKKDKGDLDINVKMVYDGRPIGVFERVAYPTGGQIFFDRVDVFLSDIAAQQSDGKWSGGDNTYFLDFATLQDVTQVATGIRLNVPDLLAGKYQQVEMGIGLDTDWNGTSPSDYDTNHPLSNNYWEAWNGYIFMVIEGKADMDEDGIFDFSFSYHVGKDEAYKLWNVETGFDILENEATSLNITFDLLDVLSNAQNTLNLEENQTDHSSKPEVYDFLHGNFINAFKLSE